MHLFYSPDIQDVPVYVLSEEESKHAVRVLRLNTGDEVWLTDGIGSMYRAQILDNHPKRCSLQIVERMPEYGKRNYRLHMAVAPTKNNARFEWFLEKATEIGIDEITPLLCDYSERDNVKVERLNKVITAAVKQSLKAYHPKLNVSDTFANYLKFASTKKAFIAWCNAPAQDRLENFVKAGEEVVVFIGPEGGFSEKEITQARAVGVTPVSISTNRLRTETAAVVACHSIAFINKA